MYHLNKLVTDLQMKFRVIISIVPILMLWMGSCGKNQMDEPTSIDTVCLSESMKSIIDIDKVTKERAVNHIYLSGQIKANPDTRFKVYPVHGGQVNKVNVRVGDVVKVNQILASIDSPEVIELGRSLYETQTALVLKERRLKLVESLRDGGVASELDVIEAKRSVDLAMAKLKRLQLQKKLIGYTDEDTQYHVRAPASGTVIKRSISPGAIIKGELSEQLFEISDLSRIWVIANIYESDISKIMPGQPAIVSTISYSDRIYHGKVKRISNVLDLEKRVAEAVIELDNSDGKLKPGMFATVKLETLEYQTTPTIPSKAVIFDNNLHYVVVYHDDCIMEVRPIKISFTNGERAYITEGLTEGERVISGRQLLVYNALISQ